MAKELSILESKFAQKWIQTWEFRKLMLQQKSVSSRYSACQFSDKTKKFDYFGLNLLINGFRDGNWEN